MIKLIDILKEAIDTNSTWYHGSTVDINQSDLDPLFRQNKGKEFMAQKAQGQGNTGSQNGVGIYFGKDKKCMDSFCPMNYTGFYSTNAKQGFMYEMKLKPNTKIESKNDLHNIGVEAFNRFKQEGIDAFTNGAELNLLNPEVIQSFRKIMEWKVVPALVPNIKGKKGEVIEFNNDQEMLGFVKKELGDYSIFTNKDGFKNYISKDDNIEKSFIESTDNRKWFTGINEGKNAIKYSKPNFEKEWDEAERYPEFKEMGKDKWVELAQQGSITKLSKIKNVLSNVDLDFDGLDSGKKERFVRAFERGTIEMPIAVKFGENEYDLVAGNTRVAGLVKNHIDPSIWVVNL
jgi:hypothetical protein